MQKVRYSLKNGSECGGGIAVGFGQKRPSSFGDKYPYNVPYAVLEKIAGDTTFMKSVRFCSVFPSLFFLRPLFEGCKKTNNLPYVGKIIR
jgi:hypothetical protein